MANGSNAVIVGDLNAAVSGRGAGRNITLTLGGSSWTGFRGAAGSAQDTGWVDSSNWLTEPGEYDFTISGNGSFYFARSRNGTGDSYTDGYRWAGKLGGRYRNVGSPSAPRNLRIRATGPGAVHLDWDGPADDGGTAVNGWTVHLATSPDFSQNFRTGGGADYSGFAPGATIYARVAARNAVTDAAGSSSQFSNVASVTTATIPGAPGTPRVTQPALGVLRVEWDAPADTGGADVLEYQLGTDSTVATTARFHEFTGVAEGTSRTFTVRARNAVGWGPYSAPAAGSVAGLPDAPRSVVVTQAGETGVKVTWSTPADDGGEPVTGYTLLFANPLGGVVASVDVAPGARSYTWQGQPSRSYTVKVGTRARLALEPVWAATQRIVLRATTPGTDAWSAFGVASNALLTPLVPEGVRRGSIYSKTPAPAGLLFEIANSGTGSTAQSAVGLQRTFTGLTVGEEYHFSATATALEGGADVARFKLGGVGLGSSDWGTTTTPGASVKLPTFVFTATSETHTLRVYAEGASWGGEGLLTAVGLSAVTLTEHTNDSPYRLAPTVFESSLLNHYTRSCASVGAAVWVGRDDVTRFREYADVSAVRATFTDTRAAGKLEYTDVVTAHDTRNLVTAFNYKNSEIGPDGNELVREGTIAFPALTDAVGLRTGSLETNLDVPTRYANLHTDPNGVNPKDSNWLAPFQEAKTQRLGTLPTWMRLRDTLLATYDGGVRSVDYRIGQFVNPTPGDRWVFGARVRGEATTTGGGVVPQPRVRLAVYFLNNVGILRMTQTPWQPLSDNFLPDAFRTGPQTVPAGTERIEMHIELAAQEAPNNALITRPLYIDVREVQAVTLFDGETDPGYIDGDQTPPQGFTWLWEDPAKRTGRTREEDSSDFYERAWEVFKTGAVWEERVVSLRWNAQEDPNLAVQLDVQDRVTVERRGVEMTDYRVVGIRHEVSGERWMINLDLVPNEFA